MIKRIRLFFFGIGFSVFSLFYPEKALQYITDHEDCECERRNNRAMQEYMARKDRHSSEST